MSTVRAALERAVAELGPLARRDAPLGPLTTYRVGGPAAVLVEASDEADLAAVARAVKASGLPTLVVGRGSNLLVADAGFPGIAITLSDAFATISATGTSVRAGAATTLPVLARRTAAAGLTGLEWAVGVPGSVGGGLRMNAGGHGSDVKATLSAARLFDLVSGQPREVEAAALDLGYRRSAVGSADVVVAAEFGLAPGDRSTSEATIAEIVRWRREHQPGGSNAGSVFTNPPHGSAGQLIDEAGLKGLRHRSAFVSPKHANFIQVDEGGSADDVRALLLTVQRKVEELTGIRLRPELHLVGFGELLPSTGD